MNQKGLLLILRSSTIFNLMRIIWERAKRYSKYSFLLGLSRKEFNAEFFKGSKIVGWIIILYSKGVDTLIIYFKASGIAQLSNKFYFSPVKSVSSLAIAIILIAVPFLHMSQVGADISDWIEIATVLFIAFNGLFCNANWEEVKKGSLVLNKIFRWPKKN